MSDPSEWTPAQQLVMAHWQDGVVVGLMQAADIVERNGDPRMADDIRDTLVHFVVNIANDLPIEAYETPAVVAG